MVFGFVFATRALFGCSTNTSDQQDPKALATSLVTKAWEVAVTANDEEFIAITSPAYRLQKGDGTGAWQDEYVSSLDDPTSYDLTDFTIADVQARLDGDVLVATYTVDLRPTPFLASFIEHDGTWLLVSEANFGGAESTESQ